MGRYENTLKYVQLRSLIEDKKYDEALEKAKQLELKKIKDVSELKIIADVYRKCGDYNRAKELYYTIYSEQKIRRNLYNLIMLCLKDKCFDEAESLYEEYNTIDKNSIYRYILRYRIDKSREADIKVIIDDLEVIKREYYMEDWGYELAKQYHKAGLVSECIEECDDIILWFGEGEIVERARLLKMHYENNVNDDIEDVKSDIGDDVSRYMDESSMEEAPVEIQDSEDISDLSKESESALSAEPELSATEIASDMQPESDDIASEDNNTSVYNTDKEKVLNNALSEAAELKNAVTKDTNDINMDDIKVEYEESDEIAEQLEAELADNIAIELDSEVREIDDTDEVEDIEENEESIDDINIAPDPKQQMELSKYGYKIDYIMESELYEKMDGKLASPANYAISLLEHGNATEIVKGIAKRIGENSYIINPKIAKISADKLNTINLEDYIEDLLGTCIMVENASKMSAQTVNRIIRVIDAHPSELVIILVDKEEPMSRFLLKEAVLSNQISSYVIY